MPQSSAKEMLLRIYEREHATTRKVLRTFPADRADFRPHERSSSALQLAWTFVIEERMICKALANEQVLGSGFPPVPNSWQEILDAFDQVSAEVLRLLRSPDDAELHGSTTFFVAPKQTGDIPRAEFVMFMLHDQIHHRGQMSVYLRMAGAKVPSIYGPSADEPWL